MDGILERVIDKLTEYNIAKQDIDYYISTPERKTNGFVTVVTTKEKVFKIPLGNEAVKILFKIVDNNNLISTAGLTVVHMDVVNNVGIMDRIYACTVVEYIQGCIKSNNQCKIFECLTHVYKDILSSSECVCDINEKFYDIPSVNKCNVLKYGFTEILPQNTFYKKGKMIYFDQEAREDNIPAEYIFARYIRHLYYQIPYLHFFISLHKMLDYYSCIFKEFWNDFSIIGYKSYTSLYIRNNNNKQIMKLDKQIYIVGAGNYCLVFLDIIEQCGRFSDVKLLLDNDESKWGKSILGIDVQELERNIDKLPKDACVVVAIKECRTIYQQLELLAAHNTVFLIKFNNYELKLVRFRHE